VVRALELIDWERHREQRLAEVSAWVLGDLFGERD
jgi:hypothetical protein